MSRRAESIRAQCQARLAADYRDALFSDPARVVATPSFGPNVKFSAAAILLDQLAGNEAAAHELVRMLADAVKGDDMSLRASLLLSARIAQHASHHAADMADELSEVVA